jgi:ankyrin repeat protein
MIDGRALLLNSTLSLVLAGCGQPGASPPPSTASVPSETSSAAVTPTKESELIAAAVKGDNAELTKLLADGVNVNAKDSEGGTALAHAAWFGHLDTVKFLLEKGADVNAKKNDRATPLLLATWNKHPDVVEVLTKAGAK